MIDRQHGKILIECDSCPEVFEGDPGEEFADVWSTAKTRCVSNGRLIRSRTGDDLGYRVNSVLGIISLHVPWIPAHRWQPRIAA